MKMGDAIKSVFSKYVGFQGRARRSEYWYWILFSSLVSMGLSLIGTILRIENDNPLPSLWYLASFLPTLAVTFRRLHDTGKPGWHSIALNILALVFSFSLVAILFALPTMAMAAIAGAPVDHSLSLFTLIPLVLGIGTMVYGIVVLMWLVKDSDPAANQYGEPVK
jgi:uncharacterized membrane protein YhaH (DUF805 family)